MRTFFDHYRWGLNWYRMYRLFRWHLLAVAIVVFIMVIF
jgi:hypothetical protein